MLSILSLALSGCYDDTSAPPLPQRPVSVPNASLADVVALCGDTPMPVVQDVVVAGRITSSDEAGNFYRSVVLQDAGTGVELLAGMNDLYRVYPLGSRVVVHLQGLGVCRRYGVVQIGLMPAAGDYAVDYIGVQALVDRCVERDDLFSGEHPEPRRVTLGELLPELCGTLVTVSGLNTLPREDDPSDESWRGYRFFEDTEGRIIAVYTSGYARYADEPLPKSPVSLTGILQYGKAGSGGNIYQIKMRDESDCYR